MSARGPVSRRKSARPTPLLVVVAAAAYGRDWLAADEIRGQLQVFGFDGLTAQQVASWLGAMEREDAPRFESREQWGIKQYRLTRFAETELFNRLPGFRLRGGGS
jgi:hypothetical protein